MREVFAVTAVLMFIATPIMALAANNKEMFMAGMEISMAASLISIAWRKP